MKVHHVKGLKLEVMDPLTGKWVDITSSVGHVGIVIELDTPMDGLAAQKPDMPEIELAINKVAPYLLDLPPNERRDN